MRCPRHHELLGLTVILAISSAARANPDDAVPPLPEEESVQLDFDLSAGVWLTSFDGDIYMGGGIINLGDDLDLDYRESVFRGEVQLRVDDRWQVRAAGFDFSTNDTDYAGRTLMFGDVTLNPGDRYHAEADMSSFALDLGMDLHHLLGRPAFQNDQMYARVTPFLGVRYVDAEVSLEALPGAHDRGDGQWFGLYLGAALQMRYEPPDGLWFLQAIEIGGSGSVGTLLGEELVSLADVRGGLTLVFTDHIAGFVQYRLLNIDADDGDFELQGGLAGLYLGGSIRF